MLTLKRVDAAKCRRWSAAQTLGPEAALTAMEAKRWWRLPAGGCGGGGGGGGVGGGGGGDSGTVNKQQATGKAPGPTAVARRVPITALLIAMWAQRARIASRGQRLPLRGGKHTKDNKQQRSNIHNTHKRL